MISSQVDQVLEHEPDAAADVLLVDRLFDFLEVHIERGETLKEQTTTFINVKLLNKSIFLTRNLKIEHLQEQLFLSLL